MVAQLSADPAIAVGLKLVADRHHGRDDLGVIDFARRRVIKSGARQAHQSASFGDREATGPVMTDVVALLGRGAFSTPPLKLELEGLPSHARRPRKAFARPP